MQQKKNTKYLPHFSYEFFPMLSINSHLNIVQMDRDCNGLFRQIKPDPGE